MDPSILGKRVAQARKKKGWTQEQLCREARVALNTVARLEQGHLRQLRTDTLVKLADALGASTDHLLGRNVAAKPNAKAPVTKRARTPAKVAKG